MTCGQSQWSDELYTPSQLVGLPAWLLASSGSSLSFRRHFVSRLLVGVDVLVFDLSCIDKFTEEMYLMAI